MHNIFFKQDFGTILGFCTSMAIFIIVIKILVKIEIREKVDSIDIEVVMKSCSKSRVRVEFGLQSSDFVW